jgi:hypothetical protein
MSRLLQQGVSARPILQGKVERRLAQMVSRHPYLSAGRADQRSEVAKRSSQRVSTSAGR